VQVTGGKPGEKFENSGGNFSGIFQNFQFYANLRKNTLKEDHFCALDNFRNFYYFSELIAFPIDISFILRFQIKCPKNNNGGKRDKKCSFCEYFFWPKIGQNFFIDFTRTSSNHNIRNTSLFDKTYLF